MSYVDAVLAPQRKTGQIKLHGPAAFEGMRKAGRLAAECLDMLAGEVEPSAATWSPRRLTPSSPALCKLLPRRKFGP